MVVVLDGTYIRQNIDIGLKRALSEPFLTTDLFFSLVTYYNEDQISNVWHDIISHFGEYYLRMSQKEIQDLEELIVNLGEWLFPLIQYAKQQYKGDVPIGGQYIELKGNFIYIHLLPIK